MDSFAVFNRVVLQMFNMEKVKASISSHSKYLVFQLKTRFHVLMAGIKGKTLCDFHVRGSCNIYEGD